jgi:hypothetical protein
MGRKVAVGRNERQPNQLIIRNTDSGREIVTMRWACHRRREWAARL